MIDSTEDVALVFCGLVASSPIPVAAALVTFGSAVVGSPLSRSSRAQ